MSDPIATIDKIIRNKVYQSPYYKEKCFALNASSIIDRAIELKSVGGTYGGSRKPAPFLCLLLKLLQISPERGIIAKYIQQDDSKYLRALGAIYLRLTAPPLEVFGHLEPLLNDYKVLKFRNPDTSFALIHMDEYADALLTREIFLDIALPYLPDRHLLEEQGILALRESILDPQLVFTEPEEATETLMKPKKKQKKQETKLVTESVEYWNKLRQDMNLPPLRR